MVRPFQSLQGRLLLTFLVSVGLAVAVTLVSLAGLVIWFTSGGAADPLGGAAQIARVSERAGAVGRAVEQGEMTTRQAAQAATDTGFPMGHRVQVVDMNGQIWVDTAGDGGGTVAASEVLGWLAPEQDGGAGRVISAPIRAGGRLWGYYVYSPPGWENPASAPGVADIRRVVGWVLVSSQGFVLLVSLLLFFHFGRRLVSPVRRLSAVVGRIAEGDLTARANLPDRTDELGRLSRDVDMMASSLQEARERAAAAEETRRFTVAAVSHDLRTPLTALLAHAEMLRAKITDDPEKSVAVIEDKGLQMQRLIADLFELASLDADRGPWPNARIDVAELVRETVAAMVPQMEQAGVEVEPEIPDESMPADLPRGKLERVLDNLLSNALKYGRDGRWIGVKVERRRDVIWIAVADRGPGIPSEEQGRIFDRYYRTNGARSGRTRGTGLGLAVCSLIIGRIGGRIGVETPAEGGARFWVEVPANVNPR